MSRSRSARGASEHSVSSRAIKVADAGALDQSAAVEEILRPQQAHQFALGAFLDAALDDDVKAFRRCAFGDDRLIGTEIGDVERTVQNLDFFGGQAVERRRRIRQNGAHGNSSPKSGAPDC